MVLLKTSIKYNAVLTLPLMIILSTITLPAFETKIPPIGKEILSKSRIGPAGTVANGLSVRAPLFMAEKLRKIILFGGGAYSQAAPVVVEVASAPPCEYSNTVDEMMAVTVKLPVNELPVPKVIVAIEPTVKNDGRVADIVTVTVFSNRTAPPMATEPVTN